MILVDTNVVVYAINQDAPQHTASRALIEAVRAGDLPCTLVPQILLEFFAIVTDGRRVARPLDTAMALDQIRVLQSIFPVRDVCREALSHLPRVLASQARMKGGDVFDAWLVAQMLAMDINRICTYNGKDFLGYDMIRPVTPEELVQVSS